MRWISRCSRSLRRWASATVAWIAAVALTVGAEPRGSYRSLTMTLRSRCDRKMSWSTVRKTIATTRVQWPSNSWKTRSLGGSTLAGRRISLKKDVARYLSRDPTRCRKRSKRTLSIKALMVVKIPLRAPCSLKNILHWVTVTCERLSHLVVALEESIETVYHLKPTTIWAIMRIIPAWVRSTTTNNKSITRSCREGRWRVE